MKSSSIFSTVALAGLALANNNSPLAAHEIHDLAARAIDPATMDPTRLSVLSVMRTAIPSGPDFPKPTDGSEPEWWQKLPEDVKSLLPILYPATELPSVAVSATPDASTVFSTTQLTVTKTVQYAPSRSASAEFGISVNGSLAVPTPTNGSAGPAASTPPAPFEGGAKGRSDVELFAAVAWVGIATGFFLFG